MHAQAHAGNRRARRNAPGNVEGKHCPANVALARSAGEKVIARAIAKVDINVPVQRVVLARVKSDRGALSAYGVVPISAPASKTANKIMSRMFNGFPKSSTLAICRLAGPSLRVNTPPLALAANLMAAAVDWDGDEAWGSVSGGRVFNGQNRWTGAFACIKPLCRGGVGLVA